MFVRSMPLNPALFVRSSQTENRKFLPLCYPMIDLLNLISNLYKATSGTFKGCFKIHFNRDSSCKCVCIRICKSAPKVVSVTLTWQWKFHTIIRKWERPFGRLPSKIIVKRLSMLDWPTVFPMICFTFYTTFKTWILELLYVNTLYSVS